MKIQLIQAPVESKELRNEKWFTPLGLMAVGTYLENVGYDIEILDGLHYSLNNILDRLDSDIVGINFNIFSTSSMEKISEHAKNQGSLVVVGGQAATPLYKQLLTKNRNIDIVVRYDGEEALRQIAERKTKGQNEFNGIPNIAFKKDGVVVEEKIAELEIEKLLIPNRRIKGVNLERYITYFDGNTSTRPTNTYTMRGCNRTCSFCGRIYKGIRTRTPEQVFEEDRRLVEEFGVNYIWEMADTFFADVNWLKRFKEIYKNHGGLPVRYWAFCDIRDINPETVKIMKELNVDRVCVGIETGSEELRRKNGKNFTNREVYEAAEQLGKSEIILEDSYVLGLIGETEETVKQTHQISQKVVELCKTERTSYSLVLPLPGSPIWKKMMQIPELQSKYGQEYKFDIKELRKDFISNFCNL